MLDDLLKKFNLKYKDLDTPGHSGEKEQLFQWINALEQNRLTIDGVKEHLAKMRTSVELELCKVGHDTKQDLFLKARLKNYLLLEALLISPEKAKEQIEKSLAMLAGAKL